MHDAKASVTRYLLDLTAVGHARRHFHLGIAKQAWWWMLLGAKNWQREKMARGGFFSQIPCRRHDAARFFGLHRQCLRSLSLANCGLLTHTGAMPARIYATTSLQWATAQWW